MAEDSNWPLAILNRGLVDARGRELPHIPLRCAQCDIPFPQNLRRRQPRVPRFCADEPGNVFEALPHHIGGSFGHDGQIAHAEFQQTLAASRCIDYVDRFEIDAFTRKKLFRP
jgi:hypothetical protein